MGEAKRRSKSDPNYGKFFDLSSASAKQKHSELVLQELFTFFSSELKILMSAKTFPAQYPSICERISSWFEQRLLPYRPGDREYIAQFILGLAVTLGEEFSLKDHFGRQDDISLALFHCLFQATKHYLNQDALINLKLRLQDALEHLEDHDSNQLFTQSLLEQIQ